MGITWHTDREGALRTAEEVRSHGRRAAVARMDLTELPDAARVVDDLAASSAGSTSWSTTRAPAPPRPFLDLPYETVRAVLDVDLVRPFLCTQFAARRMIQQAAAGASSTHLGARAPAPGRRRPLTARAKGDWGC
ncbi:hypothetical protein [Streptomyces somaliensis]|uniref:hypothetical protein n=1 Tax=Streptomyces somaliensis TaxID=78355 RepID=UPI0034E972FE|nr:hypothetical protein [Streptomyces somaliensis]